MDSGAEWYGSNKAILIYKRETIMEYSQIKELIATDECGQMLARTNKQSLPKLKSVIGKLNDALSACIFWQEAMDAFRGEDSFVNFEACQKIVSDALKANSDANFSEYEIVVCTAYTIWFDV